MRVCHCTLPAMYGPGVCIGCPNNPYPPWASPTAPTDPCIPFPASPLTIPPRVKRIIEKFDERGNLVERITEEP
jgi:hypothetical protein